MYVTKRNEAPIKASETDAQNDSGVAIEVTPEMIEAGLEELISGFPDSASHYDGRIVARIFLAMQASRSASGQRP